MRELKVEFLKYHLKPFVNNGCESENVHNLVSCIHNISRVLNPYPVCMKADSTIRQNEATISESRQQVILRVPFNHTIL